MNDNKWHMYILTRNNNVTKVYIDGELATLRSPRSRYRTAWKLATHWRLWLRLRRFQKAYRRRFWQGNITRGFCTNRVLSANEIAELYRLSGMGEGDTE